MAMPKFMGDGIEMAKKALSPGLESNQAINRIGKGGDSPGFLGGIPGTVINMRKGDNFMEAAKNAHTKDNGKLNAAPIAGSFMVAGLGYRALSGGGVYKDSNGNTDVAGIPFV